MTSTVASLVRVTHVLNHTCHSKRLLMSLYLLTVMLSEVVVRYRFVFLLTSYCFDSKEKSIILITMFTWLTKPLVVALLILLFIQSCATIALADDYEWQAKPGLIGDSESAATHALADERRSLTAHSTVNEKIVLSVHSMPLSVFADAIEESMSISINVDKSIADFMIDGQFDGTIDSLVEDLYERYGISHSLSDNGYSLWRDSDYASHANYQFQLFDMNVLTFLNYLSQEAGYRLLADTSIDTELNGSFSGTLQDIIEALSLQYPVLFYISDDTISVVPESSFVKEVVSIPENKDPSKWYLSDLRTKFPPGNFVSHKDNQLIVGGHPDFVKITSLKIQVAISKAVAKNPEPKAQQFPVMLGAMKITQTETPVPQKPENLIVIEPPSPEKQPVVITTEQPTKIISVDQIPGFY